MENSIKKENSEFCACEKEFKFQIITCPEDDTPTQNVCEFCDKPTPEPLRFTFNFHNNSRISDEY
jgi:hypothetical protein